MLCGAVKHATTPFAHSKGLCPKVSRFELVEDVFTSLFRPTQFVFLDDQDRSRALKATSTTLETIELNGFRLVKRVGHFKRFKVVTKYEFNGSR
jgi:hypothetical protein